MPLSLTTLEKLRTAFGKTKLRCDDETLPVGLIHADQVPIRGSIHIGTGRVISRRESDRRLKKTLSK